MTTNTIAAVCAFGLLDAATAWGIEARKLPPFEVQPGVEGIETRIPFVQLLDLWEGVMRLVQDPGFPMFVGSRFKPKDFDAICFACMTRENLGEATKQAVRYARVWSEANDWKLAVTKEATTLTFVRDDLEPAIPLGLRCGTESLLCEMICAGRIMTGVDYAPIEVRFRHPKPDDTKAHEAFFRCELVWGAAQSELVIDSKLNDLPLLKADPALAAFFERHVNELMQRFGLGDRAAQKVRSVLADDLRRGLPTLESVASRLAMSARTLRRRLQEEGTTFQDVLDEVRCGLAKRYLDDERLAVGEVAFLLGFSEPSAFHRAFKRWTGTTPLAHRRGGAQSAA